MKSSARFASFRTVFSIVVLVWFSIVPFAVAQQGQDAVYQSPTQVTNSPAFIDASTFLNPGTQGRDLCDTIYYIFTHSYPSTGAVIDARGISGATNLTCSHGSPWTEGSNTVSSPSTILLPATTAAAPIVISSKWILPSYTHLVGQGGDINPTGLTTGTTIQASGTFPASNAMIQFGSSSNCCTAISVENLTLWHRRNLGRRNWAGPSRGLWDCLRGQPVNDCNPRNKLDLTPNAR